MKLAYTDKRDRGLTCPGCASHRLQVLYTRHRARSIMRVRRCRDCGRRVVTHERLAGT
jgi:transcriptional regulator NrdR family protein